MRPKLPPSESRAYRITCRVTRRTKDRALMLAQIKGIPLSQLLNRLLAQAILEHDLQAQEPQRFIQR